MIRAITVFLYVFFLAGILIGTRNNVTISPITAFGLMSLFLALGILCGEEQANEKHRLGR